MAQGWHYEPGRHALAAKGVKTVLPMIWMPKIGIRIAGMAVRQGSPKWANGDIPLMSVSKIQDEINQILFDPTPEQIDKEIIYITVLKGKAGYFDFLKGYTRINAVGNWKNTRTGKAYKDEADYEFEIEYKDDKTGRVGHRLIELLEEYNARVIKEDLLYVRSEKVDESTL